MHLSNKILVILVVLLASLPGGVPLGGTSRTRGAGAGKRGRSPGSKKTSDTAHPRNDADEVVTRGGIILLGGRGGKGFCPTQTSLGWHPSKRSWMKLPMLRFTRKSAEAVTLLDSVHLIGGYDFEVLQAVDVLKVARGSGAVWKKSPRMKYARTKFGCCAVGGLIISAGGTDKDSEVYGSIEVFHAEENAWHTPKGNGWKLNDARENFGMVSMGGRAYAAGGLGEEGLPLCGMERLDLFKGEWERMQSMREAREGFGMAALDGCIYVAGGHNAQGIAIATVEVYDESISNVFDRWGCAASMNTPRANFRLVSYGGLLYAIGGEDAEGEGLSTVERYDPSCDAWFEVPEMRLPEAMSEFAVSCPDGGCDGPVPLFEAPPCNISHELLPLSRQIEGQGGVGASSREGDDNDDSGEEEDGGVFNRGQPDWEKYAAELETMYPNEKGVAVPGDEDDDPEYAERMERQDRDMLDIDANQDDRDERSMRLMKKQMREEEGSDFISDSDEFVQKTLMNQAEQYEEEMIKQNLILNEKEKRRKKKPRYNDPD